MSDAASVAHGPSAGQLLRAAREAAGLHVATLAANLKVPVAKLEALEEDRYELLPDAVFVRALASTICRTLQVDAQPVLERLPQTARPSLARQTEGLNAPFRASSEGPRPGLLDQVSKPVALTVGALLLGALVLVFLPQVQSGYEAVTQAIVEAQSQVQVQAQAQAPVAQTPAPTAAPSVGTAPSVITAPAEPAPPVATDTPPALVRASDAMPLPTTATATPSLAMATVPAAPQSVPAPAAAGDAGGILAFRAKAASWVQVTDASGATVFRKLMEGGETAGVSGTLPLSVTVGSVAATEVEVRGKPFNLAPVSKDNVARFQIN